MYPVVPAPSGSPIPAFGLPPFSFDDDTIPVMFELGVPQSLVDHVLVKLKEKVEMPFFHSSENTHHVLQEVSTILFDLVSCGSLRRGATQGEWIDCRENKD